MSSMPSCLRSAPRRTAFGCRAFPRCLPFATHSRPAAATVIRKTVGGAEGRRPSTACEAFWTGWQKSSEEQQEAPRLLSGLFGRKEAATAEERGLQVATDVLLWVLAFLTFAVVALVFSNALSMQPALKLPYLLVMGFIIRTRVWSPTALTRTAVALKAPLPLVRLLITARALDINAVVGNDPQHTALMMACDTGNNERIRGLLSLGASPDIASKDLPRPLVIASEDGNTEAVQVLLRAGADPNSLPGDTNAPLEAACSEGHAGVVRALVNAGAPVNGPVFPAPTNADVRNLDTPLIVAIDQGHVEVVEALLQAGASPTAVYDNGLTPIGAACAADDTPGPVRAAIVHLLLQAGADPWVVDGLQPGSSSTGSVRAGYPSGGGGSRGRRKAGWPSAIDLAAQHGAAEVIPVLVAAGEDPGRAPADVSYKELQAGAAVPPLFAAAKAGHVGAVQALVAAGADVDATVGGSGAKDKLSRGLEGGAGGGGGGGGGVTALGVAVQEGHVDVVRALVAAGANVGVLCEDGRALLQVAREQGMVEMEEVLLAAEAACN